ncbi:MAG TPA: DUF58 domain-containing protein [Rhodocyclaceae bacterium]|nr:DUF58 domain-containing protein [Rhodocyclaceae bacterium]
MSLPTQPFASLYQRGRQRMRRWMQRVPGPEAQPIRLFQSRVYVLPSRAGLAMLMTLAIMLLASLNYNLALGYALTFLFGGVAIAHILHSWRTLVNLEICVRSLDEVFAGNPAQFQLHLINRNRRERPAVKLCTDQGEELTTLDVPALGEASAIINIPTLERGWMPAGRLTVETRQPLGWIRAWSYIEPDARMLVFPRPAGELPVPENQSAGLEASRSMARGHDDFAGLRDYQHTDAPSHIAWKSLARGSSLLTKQFAGGASPDWIMDWSMLPARLSLEEKISQLTQWVLLARQMGARTELRLLKERIGPGQDAMHHHDCLQRLALFGVE